MIPRDGEGGFYWAYRCSNCEATWAEQHMSAARSPAPVFVDLAAGPATHIGVARLTRAG